MKRKVWVTESWLSEKAGVSRAVLKKYRVKGEYRKSKKKGRPVEWTKEGVERVWVELGIKEALPEFNPSSSTDGTEAAINQTWPTLPDGIVLGGSRAPKSEAATISILPDLKLVTVSRLVLNKRILFAQNGSNEVLQVIVPSSEVWAIGDPLRVKPSEQHKGYYELVGKAPRWRGDRIYRHEFV